MYIARRSIPAIRQLQVYTSRRQPVEVSKLELPTPFSHTFPNQGPMRLVLGLCYLQRSEYRTAGQHQEPLWA